MSDRYPSMQQVKARNSPLADEVKEFTWKRLRAELARYDKQYTDLIRIPRTGWDALRISCQFNDVAFHDDYAGKRTLWGINVEPWSGDYVQLLHEMEHSA